MKVTEALVYHNHAGNLTSAMIVVKQGNVYVDNQRIIDPRKRVKKKSKIEVRRYREPDKTQEFLANLSNPGMK